MATTVTRMTFFKVPKEQDRQAMIKNYEYLLANQKKNGKPYIISLEAGPLSPDARSGPYTFVSKTVFASKEDFDYYDSKCEAHAWLKTEAKKLAIDGPPLMTYFTAAVSGGTGS